jgi:cysteine desulfurase
MWRKKRTFLDIAAGMTANPSSPHEEGRRAKQMLEDSRVTIARLVEAQADDVIFTSGATESNALAILGVARAAPASRSSRHALYLPSAHASIVENVKLLAEEGVVVEPLPIQGYRVDIDALRKLVRPETILITMEAICGETGVVWNTREVAQVLREARTGALLHVDASQAPHTEKMTRDHFGADLLTLDASKVALVRGIGALIAHRTIPLAPLYAGGGQERGIRPGSEAPELARAFARGLASASREREAFRASAEVHRKHLIELITEAVPDVAIQEGRDQAPHILNLSLPGRDTDYLVALLDEAGFAVSTRSACETDSEEGSRTVYALTRDAERAKSTLRISWDQAVSERDLQRFSGALGEAVAFIDRGKHR